MVDLIKGIDKKRLVGKTANRLDERQLLILNFLNLSREKGLFEASSELSL